MKPLFAETNALTGEWLKENRNAFRVVSAMDGSSDAYGDRDLAGPPESDQQV